MLKKSFRLPLVVFVSSILLLYLQPLLVPRTLCWLPEVLEWFALAALACSSLSVVYRATLPRSTGARFFYPVAALVAVAGYFTGVEELQHAGDRLDFRRRKARVEAHVAALPKDPRALAAAVEATATGRHRGYLAAEAGSEGYDVLPSRIVLCTIGGAVSQRYWGYAYTPAGLPPSGEDAAAVGGDFFHWRQLEGPWYVWVRSDG